MRTKAGRWLFVEHSRHETRRCSFLDIRMEFLLAGAYQDQAEAHCLPLQRFLAICRATHTEGGYLCAKNGRKQSTWTTQ
jgi:hypothetical protein